MRVYGAIASAEDAPLLHVDKDQKKPSPLFAKGARKTTIALAVAGVAACGAVAIAKVSASSAFGGVGKIHALGDALDDAKAGKIAFQFDLFFPPLF